MSMYGTLTSPYEGWPRGTPLRLGALAKDGETMLVRPVEADIHSESFPVPVRYIERDAE